MAPLLESQERDSVICLKDKNLHDTFLAFDKPYFCTKKERFWSYKKIS
jgi:hypothetical protein